MTKREMFEKLMTFAEVKADAEIYAAIGHEVELLDLRKEQRSNKPSKKAVENAAFGDLVLTAITEAGKPFTFEDIRQAVPELADASSPKLTAIIKPLVASGTLIKGYGSGKILLVALKGMDLFQSED